MVIIDWNGEKYKSKILKNVKIFACFWILRHYSGSKIGKAG
jgi:hypothetical protein